MGIHLLFCLFSENVARIYFTFGWGYILDSSPESVQDIPSIIGSHINFYTHIQSQIINLLVKTHTGEYSDFTQKEPRQTSGLIPGQNFLLHQMWAIHLRIKDFYCYIINSSLFLYIIISHFVCGRHLSVLQQLLFFRCLTLVNLPNDYTEVVLLSGSMFALCSNSVITLARTASWESENTNDASAI